MKQLHMLILISLLNACSLAGEVNKGDENAVHKIYCSGSKYDWDTCYENAKTICGDKNYEVIEKYEDQGALAAYGSSQVLPDRRLIIQCKE